MRRTRSAVLLAAATLLATPVLAQASQPASSWSSPPVFQPWLDDHLDALDDLDVLRVAVRGETLADARAAVAAAGLGVQQEWRAVRTVVGVGTAAQVEQLREQPGVEYVEGDTPLEPLLQTAHAATRSDDALAAYPAVDGAGVSIAVIDSGIDGTHPMFEEADGSSKVVANLKNVCGIALLGDPCFQQLPTNDTDTISVGGHGTHVAGIAAGNQVVTEAPAGTELRGSAPGAKLVGLSVGAAIGLLDAMAAQNWVLEHQLNPCAEAFSTELDPDCPPILVTNHSYGPLASDGENNEFSESSTAVRIQRALVGKGVVAVWAAGNDGGNGEFAYTNPTGMDPTPGVLMVASYDDGQTGNPDNALSSFSSRGRKGAPLTYPDLAAPGDRITSSCRATLVVCQGAPSFDGGDYQTISGTSMAAPYVAGVVAQMFQADPGLTPADVEDILEDTAHKFDGGTGYEAVGTDETNPDDTTSFDKGHGLVDVLAALGAVNGETVAEQEPAAPLEPRCGDGTDLVTDPSGDTNAPGGTGAPAPGQDITSLSFASADGLLRITATYADLSQAPAPGSAFTTHNVTWVGPDGVRYGVDHSTPGGGYRVGTFDATSNRLSTGTTTAVTGTFTGGPGGQITWDVPAGLVGDPVVPIDPTTDPEAVPAVSDSYGVTIAGIGAAGSGLVFTAPVDRAPDGGATQAWSVCASEPVDDGSGDPGTDEPPAEDPPAERECEPKGKKGRNCDKGKP